MKNLTSFVTGVTAFINGIGRLGSLDKVTLPKFEKVRETITQGGYERSIDTGIIKAQELEAVFCEYHDSVYAAAASSSTTPEFVFKSSIQQGKTRVPLVATMRGDFDIEDGDWETGKKIERKAKMYIDFYSLEIDGIEQCLFDLDNTICRIHGTDYFQELRNHIL